MITIVPFLQKVDAVILNPLLEALFAIAVVYFIYAVIRLIRADGSDKSEARKAVFWSLIGMFVMLSVYGILSVLIASFQINDPNATSFIQGQL